ncbi:dedicator of cytokinesis protein 1-like isoform X2 [Homarus americanus]|uniref:dedicator of cytokinesis protein 1-like isoform X2 n=1 Tax=Homarus americanus TaxID=6706 RepID=UPI001C465035|nr:dedicator of cytokinesis protein 1-like isoform X2 [Homarus americanus]
MMSWTPARDREKYGVAIYNFSGINEACIKLNVGNTVQILEELGGWFFGYTLDNKALRGVFPKSYIQVRDCIVDKSGPVEVVTARLPPIVQEVTAVLREWGVLLRKLYVERSKEFTLLRDTMTELIVHRSKILCGQLPGDELKQLKHRITLGIDRVNAKLGLDLVVRDENGNILNPDITSAVKLFRHHDEAAAQLRKHESSHGRAPSVRRKSHLAWTALVAIKNIIIKVPEPSEISLGLYIGDPREGREKPLTEAFIIPWTDEGYNSHPDLLLKLKCLFTDLSTATLDDNQVWLIGSVVRLGSMASKEVDPRRVSSMMGKKSIYTNDSMRRPFGVLMMDITPLITKQRSITVPANGTQDEDHFATFYPCGEKETLDMKKLLSRDVVRDNKTGFQGIWFTFQLINGDIKQLQEDNPHYVALRDVPVALRLGLSDVIMPGDVRNDLYVTLLSGEFSRGAKTCDRNVEVTVRICNERGEVIPGVIHQGCGQGPLDEYHSVTYHHEGKPRWAETFKITLPIEEFKKAHIKFTFRHRSTNDVKDKNEKPFSMSFVKLMQSNGTTLLNTEHELIVYKIDGKKWNDGDSNYLSLPWRRINGEEIVKSWNHGVAPSLKDSFTISTTFCSTKLTQNAELLRLLEWGWSGSQDKQTLLSCLQGLRRVPPEELMVFLQDTLDVLLEILMNNTTDDESDNYVFEALIYVITIATDKNKHEAFQPVLDSYIQQNFHATLAYNKLIHVLKDYVREGQNTKRQETLKKAMKCLQYVFKFITRSRQLFVELYGRGQEEFEKSLQQLLEEMALMMKHTVDTTLTVQAHCLKYITTTIPDIITNFDPIIMSEILVKMIDNLEPRRIPKQKLMTMNEIIHSELFKIPDCRRVLLPSFIVIIRSLLDANEEAADYEVVMRKERNIEKLKRMLDFDSLAHLPEARNMTEELELCVKILGDILDVLFSSDVGPTIEDISLLSFKMLEAILSTICRMTRDDPLICKFVSALVSLLRQMTERHYKNFLNKFQTSDQLCIFLLDLLLVVENLVKVPVFPSDWAEMILLQNSVIVTVLKQCSRVICERLLDPFKEPVWCKFFHCAISFITQPSLQLEDFTQSKRNKIISRYRDMRRDTSLDIKSLWFSLGQHKIRFVAATDGRQSMVGPFLKMTMLPDVELRKGTIPIFFDMMQCEFYSSRDQGKDLPPDMARNNQKNKGKFNEFENEMLEKLDQLVESGHGDEHYRQVFQNIIGALYEDHATMREPGRKFVSTVTRLMDRLLQYRTIMNTPDNSAETRMSCIVNLLDFYSEINRKELYLRYVYKLSELHLACDNYTEAGYTLRQHADLLRWSSDPLSVALRSPHYLNIDRHDELKEKLYEEIISYFDKGKMWEDAVKLCKELVKHYEEVIVNYVKLSDLLNRMAGFYRNIMNPQNLRPESEYFRVAYYGRGFPAFLQNKVFVYRGNGFERLADFTSRILDQFPNAELMKKLTPPSDEVKESPQQFLQISKVDCAVQGQKLLSTAVAEQIRSYYRANHVKVFTYSRPFHRGQKDPTNEFATLCIEKTTLTTSYSLPGILRCFPVIKTRSIELSPLENAVETMSTANTEVYDLVKKYSRDSTLLLHPLTRKVSGMVDAAVMGGIVNYEKAFLTPEYIASHPNDEEKLDNLRHLIAAQIPILEAALSIHANRVTEPVAGLHEHMVTSFSKMKAQVQDKYGEAEMPEDLKIQIRPLRLQSQLSVNSDQASRSSHLYSNHDSVEADGMELGSPREESRNDKPRMSFTRGLHAISSELIFMGMSLSNSQSSLSRLSTSGKGYPGTLPRQHKISSTIGNGTSTKSSKEKKSFSRLLRRESFSSQRESSTQWFDRSEPHAVPPQPIIELTEQLTPERPKRIDAERDRYLTRPRSLTISSSHSVTPSPSIGSRESLMSTPTGSVCEEEAPPPLPVKLRDQDGDSASVRLSALSLVAPKPVFAFPPDLSPEPPRKPPRPDKNHNHEDPSLL